MSTGLKRPLRRRQVALAGFFWEGWEGSSATCVALSGAREFFPACGIISPVARSIPWNLLKLSTFLIPRSQFLQTSTVSDRPGRVGLVNDGHSFQHIWQSGIRIHQFKNRLVSDQAANELNILKLRRPGS